MKPFRLVVAALAVSAALAATPARAGEEEDMLAAARAVYAPYADASFFEGAAWDMPVYSKALSALIAEWEAGTSGEEVEDLNSFDWLCQCQDFDAERFEAVFEPHLAPGRDVGRVDVKLNLGWDGDERQESILFMVKENGRWVILDILSESFPVGLETELKWAIEDHKAGR